MSNDLEEAIGKVLFQMSQINRTLALNYKDANHFELRIQEGYTLEWVRRLVERSERRESLAWNLEVYEDSLVEFQAKRRCVHLFERGDDPPGFLIWQNAKGKEVLLGLNEDGEDDDKGRGRLATGTLDSLSEADDIFRSSTLTGAAKKLRLSREDAADLKVALPLLKGEGFN